MSQKPKIFVFCNSGLCSEGRTVEDHPMVAIAEDGHVLAGHICSNHQFALHDMGVSKDGWKRDKYAAHYPDGFEVEFVDQKGEITHPGLLEAFRRGDALSKEVKS